MINLRKAQNVERPYKPAEMEHVKKKYTLWDQEGQNILVEAIKKTTPEPMQLEVSTFIDNDKVNLIKIAK